MTAVIGILNKRGVAIAADSAVTRTREDNRKYTKNGNKMLRISNCTPISVMITGNADFLKIPWEVIVRRYREQRGDVALSSVEQYVYDFFGYISKSDIFWTKDCEDWVRYILGWLISHILRNERVKEQTSVCNKGKLYRPKTFLKVFVAELKRSEKEFLKRGTTTQFEDYSAEQFHQYARPIIDKFFENKLAEIETTAEENEKHLKDKDIYNLLLNIKDEIEHSLLKHLVTPICRRFSATLVFSGFGRDEEYPSLIAAEVNGGFDHIVNFHIKPENIIKIDDKHPVAICPFAQSDVVEAILKGVQMGFIQKTNRSLYQKISDLWSNDEEEVFDSEFFKLLNEVDYEPHHKRLYAKVNKQIKGNNSAWEKSLENYDLQSMAALANNLIALTGFHRILTFQQEGVGGPVDLAVISKNEGFTWLNRKSWYHHHDVNGQFGRFGV